ncbi:RHS repeat-associated core domain-containing protein [Sulfidibacter corallicola]|uniref:Insecticide toxin TcdB middle/N-terminal domain-containing protein n=1 Tax=Sulfidibacter corallicola TaxID=2818388 RepID=A0A8A4TJF9_SULCO|nr:RHS repeat-associated core domain-containing protein [Sulfidibacter corallicola]QTD49292.1 hypothetical protein J3U87_27210 [Sulfidibacter corallicola]
MHLRQTIDLRQLGFTEEELKTHPRTDFSARMLAQLFHGDRFVFRVTLRDDAGETLDVLRVDTDSASALRDEWEPIAISSSDYHGTPAEIEVYVFGESAFDGCFGPLVRDLNLRLSQPFPAGGLIGEFSTDGFGSANYQIGIDVPPGIGGMQPALALTYNSNTPDGLLGIGWTLSGVPSIGRGPQTKMNDGRYKPVRYRSDDKDRLYYNGQRLIAVTDRNGRELDSPSARAAAYGRDGTVYHTEIQSFMRVTQSGDMDGTASFTVDFGDGRHMILGGNDDSRAKLAGKTRTWGVDSLTDSNGNEILFSYRTDTGSSLLVDRIDYTNNGAYSGNRAVSFRYEAREKPVTIYEGGHALTVSHTLSNIYTHLGSEDVQYYALYYETSPSSGKPRLNRLYRCTYDAMGSVGCFNPMKFNYQDSPNFGGREEVLLDSLGTPVHQNDSFVVGDFYLDGFADLLYYNHDRRGFIAYHSQGSAASSGYGFQNRDFHTGLDFPLFRNAAQPFFAADLNDDGLTDVLYLTGEGNEFAAVINSASGQKTNIHYGRRPSTQPIYSWSHQWVVDFDNDGFPDLVYQALNGDDYYLLRNDGSSFEAARRIASNPRPVNLDSSQQWIADVTGDRRVDLIFVDAHNLNYYVMVNDGASWGSPQQWHTFSSNVVFGFKHWLVDANGDGLGDVVYAHSKSPGTIGFKALLSTGTSFMAKDLIDRSTKATAGGSLQWLTDINGDGAIDLLYQLVNQGVPTNAYYQTTQFGNGPDDQYHRKFGDFEEIGDATPAQQWLLDVNGDGVADVVRRYDHDDYKGIRVLLNQGKRSDLLIEIDNTMGAGVEIDYRTLSPGDHYRVSSTHPGAGQKYFFGPIAIVSSYRIKAKSNPDTRFRMIYEDGILDAERGFTGFRKTRSIHQGSKIVSETRYHTEGDLARRVKEQRSYLATSGDGEGQFLSSSTQAYEVRRKNGVITILPTVQVQTTDYDGRDGVVRTTKSYDAFGNQTVDLVENLSDPSDEDMATVIRYANDPTNWILGRKLETKIMVGNPQSTDVFHTWRAGVDQSWIRYSYDARGNNTTLEEYLVPQHRWAVESSTFDRFGNPTSKTGRAGDTVHIAYETTWNTYPHRISYPVSGLSETQIYDARWGELTTATDANGVIATTKYDGFGRPIETWTRSADGSDVLIGETVYGFDGDYGYFVEDRTRVSDTDDNRDNWSWERTYFDGWMNAYRIESRGENGDVLVRHDLLDEAGRQWRKSLPYKKGETPSYVELAYDARSRVIRIDEPGGKQTHIQYGANAQGPVETRRVSDPSSTNAGVLVTTETQYNWDGQKTRLTNPDGSRQTWAYDVMGRILEVVDPLGGVSRFSYDSRGNVLSRTEPDTGTTTYTYDLEGRRTQQTDAAGNQVRFRFDAMGRMIEEVRDYADGTSKDVTFTLRYDESGVAYGKGRVTSIHRDKDPMTWRWAYNRLGLTDTMSLEVRSGSFTGRTYVMRHEYDASGQLTAMTYPDGSVRRHQYDNAGFLTAIRLKQAGSSTEQTIVRMRDFASAGRPQTIEYGNGLTTDFTYDVHGRILSRNLYRTQNGSDLLDTRLTWSPAGKVTSISERMDADQNQFFSYDNRGRLKTASGAYGSLDYAHDANGNLVSRDDETFFRDDVVAVNRLSETSSGRRYRYSDGGWMTERQNGQNHIRHEFDAVGNLTAVDTSANGGRDWNNHERATHDYGNRTVTKNYADGSAVLFAFPGFRVDRTASGQVTHTVSIGGKSGELYAVTRAGFGNAQSAALLPNLYTTTDLRGLVMKSQWQFLAALERVVDHPHFGLALSLALLLAAMALYAWLAFRGARSRSAIGRARGVLAQLGVGLGLAGERDMRLRRREATEFVRDRGFARLATGFTMVAMVLVGPASMAATVPGVNGPGRPVAGTVRYFHTDQISSTRLVTNQSGAVVAQMLYTPYGRQVGAACEGVDDFVPKFSGKEWDGTSGLYDFGARHYDPHAGTFITPDAARQFPSPYTYAGGDPVSLIDPDGNFIVSLIVGAIIGAVIGGYFGGVSANGGEYNPAKWDWASGKTWAGIFIGAGFGAVGGALGGAAFAAGGFTLSLVVGVTSGFVLGGLEGVSLGALNGQTGGELFTSFAEGALYGALFGAAGEIAGYGVGKALGRAAKALKGRFGSSFSKVSRAGSRVKGDFPKDLGPVTVKNSGGFEAGDQIGGRSFNSQTFLRDHFKGKTKVVPWDPNLRAKKSTPHFYSVENKSGGEVFVTTELTDSYMVRKLLKGLPKKKGKQVTVLSGTHGDLEGGLAREIDFFNEDLATVANLKRTKTVEVVDVFDLSPEALKARINRPGTVVCAWCLSERSTDVIDALKLPRVVPGRDLKPAYSVNYP